MSRIAKSFPVPRLEPHRILRCIFGFSVRVLQQVTSQRGGLRYKHVAFSLSIFNLEEIREIKRRVTLLMLPEVCGKSEIKTEPKSSLR